MGKGNVNSNDARTSLRSAPNSFCIPEDGEISHISSKSSLHASGILTDINKIFDVDDEASTFPSTVEEINTRMKWYEMEIERENVILKGLQNMLKSFEETENLAREHRKTLSAIFSIGSPKLLISTKHLTSNDNSKNKSLNKNMVLKQTYQDLDNRINLSQNRLGAFDDLLKRLKMHKTTLLKTSHGRRASKENILAMDEFNAEVTQNTINKSVDEDYEILNKIGKGNFGEIVRAKHRHSGAFVAIKQLKVNMDNCRTIINEIHLMKGLVSQYCVRYFGCYFNHDSKKLSIILEYCECGSLADYIAKFDLEEPQIGHIAFQVINGLLYLHSRNICHMDVKAGNILLTRRGRLKLADYGISKKVDTDKDSSSDYLGSPYWMAPEAIIGLKNDDFHQILKIDVWSLGITFIEFVEKIPPYFKSVPQAAIFKIVNSPPPVLTQATKYSVAFQDLIGKCLVKNPECRAWPSELLLTPFLVGASKHSEALNRIIERMYSDKEIRNRKMSVTMENRRGSKIDLFENALLGTKGMDGSRSLGSGNLLKEK